MTTYTYDGPALHRDNMAPHGANRAAIPIALTLTDPVGDQF